MTLEVWCTIIVAYLFISGKWTMYDFKFKSRLSVKFIRFWEVVFPKFVGITIIAYLILKYILKVGD